MILDFLASRIMGNEFLLFTLQSGVFCNSNIKQTKKNPSPAVSQSKPSLLEIYPGSPTREHRERELIGTEGVCPRVAPAPHHWSPWELYLGFHGATVIHGSRNNSHTRILAGNNSIRHAAVKLCGNLEDRYYPKIDLYLQQ